MQLWASALLWSQDPRAQLGSTSKVPAENKSQSTAEEQTQLHVFPPPRKPAGGLLTAPWSVCPVLQAALWTADGGPRPALGPVKGPRLNLGDGVELRGGGGFPDETRKPREFLLKVSPQNSLVGPQFLSKAASTLELSLHNRWPWGERQGRGSRRSWGRYSCSERAASPSTAE